MPHTQTTIYTKPTEAKMWEPTKAQQAEIMEIMRAITENNKSLNKKLDDNKKNMESINKKLESIIEDNQKWREKWKIPEDKNMGQVSPKPEDHEEMKSNEEPAKSNKT